MGRKLTMPVANDSYSRRVEDVRKRLGGRASTKAGAGEIVIVRRETAPELLGVVLFVDGDELHVMTDESTVRRTRRANVVPAPADAQVSFASLGADARVFGGLTEGQHVRYMGTGKRLEEGTLVEKCRYGAIVLAEDRSLVGVGFRKLWPAAKLADLPS